ncbi:MAG: efflux RND transporter periplasmic adaptor subunit [Planctomycetota bacterium]
MIKKFLYLIAIGVIVISFTGGYFFGSSANPSSGTPSVSSSKTKWYCSMDPQIIRDAPGLCPICGMALVEMLNTVDEGPRRITLSPNASKLAEVATAKVERKWVEKEIRMVGKVEYDETRLGHITARIAGRLDRLYVNYTGVPVKKGEHLVSLYSPELLTTQEELIRALKYSQESTSESAKSMAMGTLEATRERLRLWGLPLEQIKEIEQNKTPSDYLTIYAPMGGIVVEKDALLGMYVSTGTKIYTIADLSSVWIKLDAYESDISWLRYGQNVEFLTEAYPGEAFSGRITFIDPILKEMTRTIKVRISVSNLDEKLKPGMFVRAVVRVPLSRDGKAIDNTIKEGWLCPMHHEQISENEKSCGICGMPMVRIQEVYPSVPQSSIPPLVIPSTAPLLTGKRAVVYVKVPKRETTFECRQIILGARAGDYYLVRAGLQEGEEVVVHGNFKIDSSLQILAKTSMMNDSGSIVAETLEVHEKFLMALRSIFEGYFSLQMALAEDQEQKASTAVKQLIQDLSLISLEDLEKEVVEEWKKFSQEFHDCLEKASQAQEMKSLRKEFEGISNQMISLQKRFGHIGKTHFLSFCPMAFGNKGAFWLQDQNETLWNPYFGSKMLHCGEFQSSFVSMLPESK